MLRSGLVVMDTYKSEQKQKTKRWQGTNTSALIIPASGLNSLLRRKAQSGLKKKKKAQYISVLFIKDIPNQNNTSVFSKDEEMTFSIKNQSNKYNINVR